MPKNAIVRGEKRKEREKHMRIEGKAIEFFQALFDYAKGKRDNVARFDEYQKQYEGSEDTLNGVKLAYRRNITYELIESQVSTTIPSARVQAERWSENGERNAIRAERFLNSVRNKLPFEAMNDKDERSCYIYGTSMWLVEWDDSIRTATEQGGISITQRSIKDFVPQPGLFRIEDMDYCFTISSTTKEDVERKYGISPGKAEETEKQSDRQGDDDTVDVVICWYRDDEGNVCQYAFSGDVELCHIEDYYSRKNKICRRCHRREGVCICEDPDLETVNSEYEEITEAVIRSDGSVIQPMTVKFKNGKSVTKKKMMPAEGIAGAVSGEVAGGLNLPEMVETEVPVMTKTKIRWYKPKSFPVVLRLNVSKEGSVYGQSDCETIKPQQEEVNKILSRMHEKLMMAGVYPYKPEDSIFITDNSIHGKVLNLKPNHTPNQYGVIDTTPNIQQDLLLVEAAYETAKKILGITASYQGQGDSSAKSGIAKQVQVQQSAGRLESKRAMKNAAYAAIDRVIFELHLAFADEPRPAAFRDEYGRLHNETFSRYDYLVYDEETGEYYYDDRYLFACELSNPMENQREMLWQINLSNLAAGVYGNPQDPATLLRYWQAQEKAHYPYATDNVEYFAMLVSQVQAQAQTVGDFSVVLPAQAGAGGGGIPMAGKTDAMTKGGNK